MFFKNLNLKEHYLFSIIITIYFFLNIYQLNFQHWSGMMDHDFYILYNSLLVSSGLEQEGRDHPAFTTFFIHGFVFKIVSLFQNSFSSNIDEILNSNKIDETLQFYFNVSRVTNFFINLFLFLAFLKLLNILKLSKKITFFIGLSFLISGWYSLSFFALRSENLSLLFFILSMIFLAFESDIKEKNFLLSGVFFLLAMLTKIQIILFFPYLIFLMSTLNYKSNFLEKKFLFFKIKKSSLIYFLFLFFFVYLAFQIKIQEFPRFEKNKYLDLFIFTMAIISIFLYFYVLSKNKINLVSEKLYIFSIFVIGFVFCLSLLILLDILNIVPVNDYIYLRVSNPIHYLSEFEAVYADGSINLKFILSLIYEIFSGYRQNLVELILLIILITFIWKDHFTKKKIDLIKVISLFVIFIFITLINGLRPIIYYHSYYTFCFLLIYAVSLDYFREGYFKFFSTIIVLIFLSNNYYLKSFVQSSKNSYINIFERKNLIVETCKEYRTGIKSKFNDASLFYLKYWHSKFDDKTINLLCKELEI